MSRIYFHSIDSTAEVSGRERGLMNRYCSEALLFALGSFHMLDQSRPWILDYIPEDCYLHRSDSAHIVLERDIKTWLNVGSGDGACLVLNGERLPLFDLQLNSAITMGGDALKLVTRIHGQCEIHCYVEGPHRNWLANLIEEALTKNIFSEEQSWKSVCEMLRGSDTGPVVCSYSVCDSFPNRFIAKWEPEKRDVDGDGWYDLPDEKQWELALAGLRKRRGLELTPENWNDFYYGSAPVSGFDFAAHRLKQTLREAANMNRSAS